MRVIDLLNKIANGEKLPKKIKVYEVIYTLDEDSLNYMDEDNKNDWLAFIDGSELTTYEVEIIEEDKKIYPLFYMGESENEKLNMIKDKINEIIDKLNKEE